MNCALAWMCAAVLVMSSFQAEAAKGRTGSASGVWISGREYVRITDWAEEQGLKVAWVKRDEVLQVTGGASSISLRVDSAESRVNGVSVWLLFAVRKHQNGLYISRLDARSTLGPLVRPARSPSGTILRTICLDAGHGGKDPGNRAGWSLEKNHTLMLAQELRDQLTRAGFKVTLTRTRDTFIDLPVRADIARQRRADLFISLHFNSATTSRSSVQGAEVYCMTPAGATSTNTRGQGSESYASPGNRNNDRNVLLAYQVQKSLTQNLGVTDRGVRRARFAVLRDATMPAVLVEAGFMSHPAEGRKIVSPAYRYQIARAIADAVLSYKRQIQT